MLTETQTTKDDGISLICLIQRCPDLLSHESTISVENICGSQ